MKDIYELVCDFPKQIRKSYNPDVPKLSKNFKRVVICGMGGSYIVGLLFKNFLQEELKMPVEVYSQENFFMDNNTLLVLISYSGNTKEILNIFKKHKKYSKNFLVLSSNGKLMKLVKKKKVKHFQMRRHLHQRFTFSYGFFPLIKIFEKSGIIKNKNKLVGKIVQTLIKNKRKLEVESKKLAVKLEKKHPVFYASNYFYPLAYRLQTSMEEDCKILCHSNKITELFHNELESYPQKFVWVFLIFDKKELKDYKNQIKFFKKLIGKNYSEFGFENYSKEERFFLGFWFVDFLGYYLSRLVKSSMGETLLSDEIKQK